MPPSPWIICRRIPFLKSSHDLHKFPVFAHISLVSFSTSTPKIPIFDYLVTKLLTKPQNADSILNFLEETGFSKNQIETVVRKVPKVLSAKLETTIKPKIKVFQDLGFHSTDFAHIISASPSLLDRSADSLRQSILGLKNVLGPNVDICRLLKYSGNGRVLGYNLERTLLPNIEYLKSCGVCSLRIASYFCLFPLNYVVKPEKLKGIVQRVDEMGVDRKSKMFIVAVKVMSSMSRENWELKLKLFRNLGFSEQNILVAFRRMPLAFSTSGRKIKEVTKLLLSVEDISYIASNPIVLSYSVEKRLEPRLRVLKALLSKNLVKKKPSLAPFLKISDAEFIKKYVSPYSNEVAALYAASQGS